MLTAIGRRRSHHRADPVDLDRLPEAIRSLELAYIVGPIIFVMLGGACVIGWRLDATRHADIRRRLDARDALFDGAPVLEGLSGEPAIAVTPKGAAPPAPLGGTQVP